MTYEATRLAVDSNSSDAISDGRQLHDVSESCKAVDSEGAFLHSPQHHVQWTEMRATKKVSDCFLAFYILSHSCLAVCI